MQPGKCHRKTRKRAVDCERTSIRISSATERSSYCLLILFIDHVSDYVDITFDDDDGEFAWPYQGFRWGYLPIEVSPP